MYLPWNASKARLKEAENARKNRVEIVKALSTGQVSRRDLIKWGLFTSAGLLAPIHGLNPFVSSAYATIPTGAPLSPLFGVQPFSQVMPRFDVLPRKPYTSGIGMMAPLPIPGWSGPGPDPQAAANTTPWPLDPAYGFPAGTMGPIEGRPPGDIWAHQAFAQFPPGVVIEVSQAGA